MCLAVPGKITLIDGDEAVVDYGSVKSRVSIMTYPDVKIGDSVLVHAGFVIAVLDEKSASEYYEAAGETVI